MTVPPQEPADPTSPGEGQTLPELLGDGAFEEPRSGYEWAVGLATVLGFLVLVSWFFGSVASP